MAGSASNVRETIDQAMQKQVNSSVAVLDDTGDSSASGSGEILRGENLRKTFRSGTQDVTPLTGSISRLRAAR